MSNRRSSLAYVLLLPLLSTTHRIDVTEYGAKGDGRTVDTAAITRAFAACAASSSSSTVVFPAPGIYLTGPWEIVCDDSTVVIPFGARVVSVATTKDWPIGRLDSPEPAQGKTEKQAAPFILLENAHNVTLTGGGELNMRGNMWWEQHCGNWWCPHGFNSTSPRAWRPYMLRIHNSTNIVVTNLSFVDPGFWCIVPTFSQGVTISHSSVTASHSSPNTDGVEPMWSSNVHIHDMTISNGDDCITVKSGSSDILVENIHCEGSHGISIGSVWYDDVKNITYRNCTLQDCRAGPRIKGRSQGNATIRDVRFENIALLGRVDTGIDMHMNYETPGSVTNNTGVTAENVTFVNVSGFADSTASIVCDSRRPCSSIELDNVHITGAKHDTWTCSSVVMTSIHDVSPSPGATCRANQAPKPRQLKPSPYSEEDMCPLGLWYRKYVNSENVTVSNYLSITPPAGHRSQLFLQNVYSQGAIPSDAPCAVTIGPYLLNVNVSFDNTTMDIGASVNATCREPLRPLCQTLGAVCRPDSAFDDTDSYKCKNNGLLEMHDGSAGSVIVFARKSCCDVPSHNFMPIFCGSQ